MIRKRAVRLRVSTVILLLVIGGLILGGRNYYLNLKQGKRPSALPVRLSQEDAAHVQGRTIALISGHLGFDTGATCDDGLTERSVNRRVTGALADILKSAGARVSIMEEYDPRLVGLKADVLLSIHADSCLPLSGFKISRWQQSANPERDDRLVTCLRYAYWLHTGLDFDGTHITDDMLQYHAFREIDPQTPAAIIETGYIGGDRDLLVKKPQVPAMGIAQGLVCFFK